MNIIIYLFVLLILLFLIYKYSTQIKEKFETYSYGPYNYMDSGTSPLTFYRYPIYRKPYMYPYQFYKSYPYPHMSYYETNI